jgi:hypothetical protein
MKTDAAEQDSTFKTINQPTHYIIQGVFAAHILNSLLYIIKA